MAHPPPFLQPILPSVSTDRLDMERDKPFIIHSVLAKGTIQTLAWLFQTYGKQTIRNVFLKSPIKEYTKSCFHLWKLVLDVSEQEAPSYLYDRHLPRHIG